MRVLLGWNGPQGAGTPIVWQPDEAVNPHVMVIGQSGTGKTHLIRRFVSAMATQQQNARVYVVDGHGDLGTDNESVVTISERSEIGLNPLALDTDPEIGGPRKCIRRFLATVNNTQWKLGTKQERVLDNLLMDAFRSVGVDQDRPETWARSPLTLDYVADFGWQKLQTLYTGADDEAMAAFKKLSQAVAKLQKSAATDQGEEVVGEHRERCLEAYAQALDRMVSGQELAEYIKYDDKEVLRSVIERIVRLTRTGVFRAQTPRFDHTKPVWRYEVIGLDPNELRLFVETLAAQLFSAARKQGLSSKLHTMLVVDEAHLVVTKETTQILNRLGREARKYGLGLLLASQQIKDFSEDLLANVATTVLLGVADYYQELVARRLSIEVERLKNIQVHQTALLQYQTRAGASSSFRPINLP